LKNYHFFQLLVLAIFGAAIFGESTNPLAQNSKLENNASDNTNYHYYTTMQGFYEFCDNDGVLLPRQQGGVRAVVGRPPRRERRRRVLWHRRVHSPDDDDDEDDNNDNVGVTLFAGNVYYSWQAIRAVLLVPIAGIILI
jgi:hypothetical protein